MIERENRKFLLKSAKIWWKLTIAVAEKSFWYKFQSTLRQLTRTEARKYFTICAAVAHLLDIQQKNNFFPFNSENNEEINSF